MGIGGSKSSSSGRSRKGSASRTWRQRWKAFNKVSVDPFPRRKFHSNGEGAYNNNRNGTKLHIFDFKSEFVYKLVKDRLIDIYLNS